MIVLEKQILFRERLPKYDFRGIELDKNKIIRIQWILRLVILLTIIVALYASLIAFITFEFIYFFTLLILTFLGIFLFSTEKILKRELDGSIPIIIKTDSIIVPSPRLYRSNINTIEVPRDTIRNASIIRGNMTQLIDEHRGVLWKNSPVSIVLILKNGKRINLGFKPPSTINDIINVLRNQWAIPIKKYNCDMGYGTICSYKNERKDYSFEDIMEMNMFEYKD
ncbi:MAG: hypothetical protein LUQ09_03695 [Methanomassiliicoccales archaeon]|nr:hypothetical protein [Methanomassiliicoccales archaeon]